MERNAEDSICFFFNGEFHYSVPFTPSPQTHEHVAYSTFYVPAFEHVFGKTQPTFVLVRAELSDEGKLYGIASAFCNPDNWDVRVEVHGISLMDFDRHLVVFVLDANKVLDASIDAK